MGLSRLGGRARTRVMRGGPSCASCPCPPLWKACVSLKAMQRRTLGARRRRGPPRPSRRPSRRGRRAGACCASPTRLCLSAGAWSAPPCGLRKKKTTTMPPGRSRAPRRAPSALETPAPPPRPPQLWAPAPQRLGTAPLHPTQTPSPIRASPRACASWPCPSWRRRPCPARWPRPQPPASPAPAPWPPLCAPPPRPRWGTRPCRTRGSRRGPSPRAPCSRPSAPTTTTTPPPPPPGRGG
ncbi:hypothetical protein DMC30DRAFT_163369 [Rhodotorula diobovata]|uniref:Uncharacterized protein n=1 Tax=Rhodotorula diobovata TaxID=5288 RepID=A0A5C5G5D5_9BASI|nr:hypothetical protein DMC30DRAFT_163369 [Rhodotorula diobovata]